MKIMKKVLSIILSLISILTVFYIQTSAKSFTEGNYEYDINEAKGTAVITKYKGNEQEVVIPQTVKDCSVIGIKSFAFAHCHSINKVIIDNNINSIGYGAFANCSSLKYIEISNENTDYCSYDNIIFNKNKTKIICYPSGKENEKYTMPDSVRELESYSFAYANNLEEIVLSDNLEIIPTATFFECSKLESVVIPISVKEIQDESFQACESLKYVCYYGDKEQWNSINKSSNVSTLLDKYLVLKDSDRNYTIKLTEETELVYSSKVPFELKVSDKSILEVSNIQEENTSNGFKITAKIKPKKAGKTTISAVAENGFVICNFILTVEQCEHTNMQFLKTEKPATCTEDGTEIYACDDCDHTETRTVNAIGHSFGEWKVDVKATQEKEGIEIRSCNSCGVTETREIPKLVPSTPKPDKVFKGDVDGNKSVTATDARKILRYVAGLDTLSDDALRIADVTGDGKVTATDARKILRHVAGLESL